MNRLVLKFKSTIRSAIAKKINDNKGQIAMAKLAIPGMAWQGYFIDTEGNTFGIQQEDKNAK